MKVTLKRGSFDKYKPNQICEQLISALEQSEKEGFIEVEPCFRWGAVKSLKYDLDFMSDEYDLYVESNKI